MQNIELNNLKVIFYLTLFVLGVLQGKLNAQTYISPVIGYDFQRVISESDHAFKISHSGFSYNSPLIGIKLRYKITPVLNNFYFKNAELIYNKLPLEILRFWN